jgi:phage shock protein C
MKKQGGYSLKKLERSITKKSIYGICGGISDYFGINVFIIRLLFILTFPIAFWIYFILNFMLPIKSIK